MRVHVFGDLPPVEREVFAGFEATFGEHVPEDTEILVHGGVSGDDRHDNVRAVIVPWAGVPEGVREYAMRHDVPVFNLHHNAGATAQTAIALLLAVTRDIAGMDRQFRAGSWSARFSGARTMDLTGKTAVVLPVGSIGQHIARACEALGMQPIGVARTARNGIWGISELEGLLPSADVLIVSLPLTEETRGLIDSRKIGLLPAGSVVVNVGRGAVFEEQPLYEALRSGHLFGAGIDVWWNYPSTESEWVEPGECDWRSLPNVVMTPHRGGTGVGEINRWRAVRSILDQLQSGDFSSSQVNLELGY